MSSRKQKKKDMAEKAEEITEEFQLKPQSVTPPIDTSNWPLLLKVWFYGLLWCRM